jgi:hypothetical protein
MKDPLKLQGRLRAALKGRRGLNLKLPALPMTEREMKDVAWVVQAYLESNDSVLDESDPLRNWLDEYYFFLEQ